MKTAWWAMLLAPLLLAGAGRAETLQQVLKAPHRQRVYDFAGVLPPSAEAKLRSRIHGMEQRHLAQGAVILVHRVEGASIESFAEKVLNRWGVGERGRNNGFVLLAAIDQRKWRLATGTGLEKKIPDAEAAQLMKSAVVPAFRKKQYAAGLDAALVAIQKRAAGTAKSASTASSGTSTGTVPTSVPDVGASPLPTSGSGFGFPGWLIALIAVPLVIVASLFGNRGGGWNRGWNGYGNSGFGRNNWMSTSNNSSSSSNSSSASSTQDSSSSASSSSSSGDYGGGSSSGGGASGSW